MAGGRIRLELTAAEGERLVTALNEYLAFGALSADLHKKLVSQVRDRVRELLRVAALNAKGGKVSAS